MSSLSDMLKGIVPDTGLVALTRQTAGVAALLSAVSFVLYPWYMTITGDPDLRPMAIWALTWFISASVRDANERNRAKKEVQRDRSQHTS